MVNLTLVVIIVAIVCWAIVVRLSPGELRRLADWCNSRADAGDYAVQRFKEYRDHRAKHEQPLSESRQNV